MKAVIIGAGPIGLIAAIKLKKMGVENVTVYDPRAGTYTRPGILNDDDFSNTSETIGENQNNPTVSPPSLKGQANHIKMLERQLFQVATSLGIHFEKKAFQDLSENGISVNDQKGNKEAVACDMIFDASGGKRMVVEAVNAREAKAGAAPLLPLNKSPRKIQHRIDF